MNALFRWSSFYWFIKEKVDKINLSSISRTQKTSVEKKKISMGNVPPKISQYIFRRNLLSFYYIAKNWEIPVLYASQPLKANIEMSDYMPNTLDEKTYIPVPNTERNFHHNFFNNIIKEVAGSTNSYFLDNDSLLAGDPKYFIDAVHYSKIGVEKLAHNYFDYIIKNNIIKRERDTNVKTSSNF